MRICSKCKEEKDLSLFHKDKKGKDGYQASCKECLKKYQLENKDKILQNRKIYREIHKDRIKIETSEYKSLNKEVIKQSVKSYREIHKDRLKEISKIYWQNNKDKKRLKDKKYKEKHKDKLNEKRRIKLNNDPLCKLIHYARIMCNQALTENGFKKSKRTEEILGCSFVEYAKHIESQFEVWMSWDNHGKYIGNYNETWQIDHITPLSSGLTEDEINKLNHYTNLRPLCSKVNQVDKGSKIIYS